MLAIVAVGAAIAVLELVGPTVNGATAAQLLLLVLLFNARFGGLGPAVASSIVAAGGFIRYFVTPGGLAVGDPNDWAALGAFLTMAIVGGELAQRAERRAREAQEQRQEIEGLYAQLQAAFDRASEAEAARRAEEVKATLLDALTHNLRTPLTGIKASVTAILGTGSLGSALKDPERTELLHVIDEECDRLNRFIEALSTSASARREQPQLLSNDLGTIIRAGLTRAESLTREHRVVVHIEPNLPPVAVEEASVAEVIYMLLDNASKYSAPGTTIELQADRQSNWLVRVTVRDEGPGIPPELRERVFEKFFRIPNRVPRDPRRSGVGLGLPIARRLIEAQAGRLTIETPGDGRGTLMVMSLPVVQEAGSQLAERAAG